MNLFSSISYAVCISNAILLCFFLFFLQFLEFLLRYILQQILLDVVFGRQLEAVFADEEILCETFGGVLTVVTP